MRRAGATLYLGVALAAGLAQAQPRPDAGSLQEQPRVLPTLPPVGGPRLTLPPEPPQQPAASDAVRITPAGFRVTGNTLFSSEVLLARIANRAGQATTLAGLNEIARTLREYYQDRGYLLTDALIPQQSLAREGGTVTIEIIEARVGQVTV